MVLHVMNSAAGGAALSTVDLIRGFADHGILSCVVCDDRGGAAERQLILDAVDGRATFFPLHWMNRKTRAKWWKRPILALLSWQRTGATLISTRRVVEFARTHNADLIHTNTIVTPEGGCAAVRLGLPHVWHLRELVGRGAHIQFWREGKRLGDYWRRHCSIIVANSEVTASHVRSWVPSEFLQVVPNGIDLSHFSAAPRLRKQNDQIVVAMVGNLGSKSKKHKLFVQSAACVDRKLPIEWRLYGHGPLLVGKKHADPYVAEIVAELDCTGLAPKFAFMGFEPDPAKIMSEIDILVHPTELESFGRVFAEAMASQVAVAAVRGGGAAELIVDNETGLLSEPNNPAALGANISRLAQDPSLRRRLGSAGRQRVETHYSLDVSVQRLLNVYRFAMQHPVVRGRPDAPFSYSMRVT